MIERALKPVVQGMLRRHAVVGLLGPRQAGKPWAIEIKRSLAPKLERGFREACADLDAKRRLVVYPGEERFAIAPGIEAIGLPELMEELRRG